MPFVVVRVHTLSTYGQVCSAFTDTKTINQGKFLRTGPLSPASSGQGRDWAAVEVKQTSGR